MIAGVVQIIRRDDDLGQLFNKQRYAVGFANNFIEQFIRQGFTARQSMDNSSYRLTSEPVKCDTRNQRMAAKVMRKRGPGGEQQEHPRLAERIEGKLDQLQGRRIDPVGVFQHP